MLKKIKNICCIDADYLVRPKKEVLAKNYPDVIVNIVDINQSRIDSWNSDDLTKHPIFEIRLDKVIEECRNKNLFFSKAINWNKFYKLLCKSAWVFETKSIINIEKANQAKLIVWSKGHANNA